MGYRTLGEFVTELARADELVRVSREVDPYLEIACIATLMCQQPPERNKAILFERVRGSRMPVLINAFGSARRLNMMAGTRDYADMTAKLGDFLALLQEPRRTVIDKLRVLPLLRDVSRCFPKHVRRGECQQRVLTGEAIDLETIPFLTTWPEDGGPFVTLPLVFSVDPASGKRNCGMYRIQRYDKRTAGFHVHTHHTGAHHLRAAKRLGRDRLEVAICIGAQPSVTFSSIVPLPPGMDEMIFAGFLDAAPVPMVRCKTIDMEVPASAEIVLEGYVPVDEMRREGPFGDHTGFYSLADDYWVFHCTAVTTRENPIYHATVVGRPPQEDSHITDAIERLFLPLMQTTLPEVRDYRLPFEGVAHNLMHVRIDKHYPGQGHKVAHAVWGLGQAMFTKVIVAVDDEAPAITDALALARFIARRLDVARDVEMVLGPTETLDHATRALHFGSKLLLDLTRAFPGEGERAAIPQTTETPTDEEMCAILRKRIPEVRQVVTPFKGEWRHLSLVFLDKSRGSLPQAGSEPGVRDTEALVGPSARTVIAAMWELFADLACAQRVVVFDAGEPTDDGSRLVWLALAHIDPERDIHFDLRLVCDDGINRALRHPRRIGIDCTTKTPKDGFHRKWPLEQRYPKELVQATLAQWQAMGLPPLDDELQRRIRGGV